MYEFDETTAKKVLELCPNFVKLEITTEALADGTPVNRAVVYQKVGNRETKRNLRVFHADKSELTDDVVLTDKKAVSDFLIGTCSDAHGTIESRFGYPELYLKVS